MHMLSSRVPTLMCDGQGLVATVEFPQVLVSNMKLVTKMNSG